MGGIGLKNDKIREKKVYKTPNRISLKRTKRLSGYSEEDLFKKISEKRCKSDLSGKYIYEIYTFCFAHLLPKGTYPQYRTVENNIAFVLDLKEHGMVDALVSGNKFLVKQWIDEGRSSSWILNELKNICKNIANK